MTEGRTPPYRNSKVGRLIADRGLDGAGEELERRWLGGGREEQSLRDLAAWFNGRLVRSAMEAAGLSPLEGEARNLYRLLADEDASSGDRLEARRSLERAGVDVDRLEESFVSHRAVHTYLTEFRGASKDAGGTDVEGVRERVGRLRGRLERVAEGAVDSLRAEGLALEGFDVLVSVRVACEECGATREMEELLRNGGCDCQRDG